eukprot:9380085-Pyramimonas_sp.AAC.2
MAYHLRPASENDAPVPALLLERFRLLLPLLLELQSLSLRFRYFGSLQEQRRQQVEQFKEQSCIEQEHPFHSLDAAQLQTERAMTEGLDRCDRIRSGGAVPTAGDDATAGANSVDLAVEGQTERMKRSSGVLYKALQGGRNQ